MILLDAYALIAALGGEAAASEVEALLRAGDVGVVTQNLAEVVDRLARRHGIVPERTQRVIGELQSASGLKLLPLSVAAGWRGGQLRAAHYHRSDCPVSLADCQLLAAAGPEDRIATADPALLRVAAAEHIAAIELSDSRGRQHQP